MISQGQGWPKCGPRATCGPPKIFCGPCVKFGCITIFVRKDPKLTSIMLKKLNTSFKSNYKSKNLKMKVEFYSKIKRATDKRLNCLMAG